MMEGLLTYSAAEIAFEDPSLHTREHQLYYIGNIEEDKVDESSTEVYSQTEANKLHIVWGKSEYYQLIDIGQVYSKLCTAQSKFTLALVHKPSKEGSYVEPTNFF